MTRKDLNQLPAHAAEIAREYGPFADHGGGASGKVRAVRRTKGQR